MWAMIALYIRKQGHRLGPFKLARREYDNLSLLHSIIVEETRG
jgi:hypothetical protein